MKPIAPEPEVHIRPEPHAWAALLAANRASTNPAAALFRRQLGLPTNVPIVMSGHQAQFWHAGILAKHFATLHTAAAHHAHPAWIVVDQDEPEFLDLRFPTRDPAGALADDRYRIVPATAGISASTNAAALPAFDPEPLPPALSAAACEAVVPALQRTREALLHHRSCATAAEQVARAAASLAAPFADNHVPTLLFASRLARTTLFTKLVQRMAANPAACHTAYNAALTAAPRTGIAPLAADAARDRLELPLWHIDASGHRRRVWSTDLGTLATETLAPRALLLTGLLRLAACDLFIHGLGGGGATGTAGYDRATDHWFAAWLGQELAPTALATATLLLPLLDHAPAAPADIAHARWVAHHARHSPAALAQWGAEQEKRALALRITRTPMRRVRAALFARMHALLADVRSAHTTRLADLAARADTLASRAATERLAADRTWPFMLHDERALARLSEMIAARVGAREHA
ncbi:MAG: hypothetical protein ACKVS8_10365 [Phycisphaerales bacterium]